MNTLREAVHEYLRHAALSGVQAAPAGRGLLDLYQINQMITDRTVPGHASVAH